MSVAPLKSFLEPSIAALSSRSSFIRKPFMAESVGRSPWTVGSGYVSAVLDTDTTRSTARR